MSCFSPIFKTSIGRTPVLAATFAGLVFSSLGNSRAEEPNWRDSWQTGITTWIKSLKEEDVAITPREFDWTKLDPTENHRNARSIGGYPPLGIAAEAMKIPAKDFLWSGIFRDEGEPQKVLTPYGMKQGQVWIPSMPTTADSLAWLYNWNRPWNAYYGDHAVANRAAVISMVDLLMIRENVHFYTSGEEGCRLPPFPPRACEGGFSLTFNAYCYLQVKSALPKEAREAWEEGLRWYADYNATARPGGPENMQLSVPVGVYYTGMALNDDGLKQKAEELMDSRLDKYFSPAGYIRDAGVPDGSYNGISMHRLAEFYAISKSPRVLEILRKAYDLKQYLTLPEPDGTTLSPSHFNARCKDGFDFDQYQGREVMILKDVPAAGFYMRKAWKPLSTEDLGKSMANIFKRASARAGEPRIWAANHRWDGVLSLPYVAYHEPDEAAMDVIMQASQEPIVLQKDRYTENLGNEFYAVRRPAYAAIFYAGPATASDTGATNHNKMLENAGGYLMGFAGGGLSAFWTPETSTVLLGRMTAYEAYNRQIKTYKWGSYLLSGWRDWLNNHVVGETAEGKILTSARTARPQSHLSDDDNKLEITGEMPGKLRKQGEITNAAVAYTRSYIFADDGIDCSLEIRTDKPLEMKSLYEVFPVLTGQKNDRSAKEYTGLTTWRFLDAKGQPIEPKQIPPPDGKFVFEDTNENPYSKQEEVSARVEGVKTFEIHRYNGSVSIVFKEPVAFSLTSVEVKSTQMTFASGRAFLVELPIHLQPETPVKLEYKILPAKPAKTASIHK